MKIIDVEVDGFGVWNNLKLGGLSEQLNVFYGPNEAGKTTLMQFARSMLYGFSADRRLRYLPPQGGGPAGGLLRVNAGAERFAISRFADADHPQGEVSVADSRGNRGDAEKLRDLLGNVDESIFNSVYAIGLREIQELSSLSDSDAAHQLYDLTLGLDRVSLFDVLKELETSRSRLVASDDRATVTTGLLAKRDRLLGEIADLSKQTSQYFQLHEERRACQRQITAREQEQASSERDLRAISLARALSEPWRQRSELRRKLANAETLAPATTEELARLERLATRLTTRKNRLDDLVKMRQLSIDEAKRLQINEPLCKQAVRLEALSEQQQWISSLASQVKSLETEILQIESARESDHEQSGLAIGAKNSAVPVITQKTRAALRAAAQGVRKARQEHLSAKDQLKKRLAGASEVATRIKTALGKNNDGDLTRALRDAGDHVAQLRRRIQLDERIGQLNRTLGEAEVDNLQWAEAGVLHPQALTFLGLLFSVGFTLAVSVLWNDVFSFGSVGLMFGGVMIIGSIFTKLIMEHTAEERVDANLRQVELLKQQIVDAKRERTSLDERLPKGSGQLTARLQQAEKDLAELESLAPLENERHVAGREGKGAKQRLRDTAGEIKKARQKWTQTLTAAGLPDGLRPKQIRDFSRLQEKLQEQGLRLERLQKDYADRGREYGSISTRVQQLAAEAGFKPNSNADPLATLNILISELAQHRGRMEQRQTLLDRAEAVRRKQTLGMRSFKKLRQKRRLILHAAGVADEAAYRVLLTEHEQLTRDQSDLAALNQSISAALGGEWEERTMSAYLDERLNLDEVANKNSITLGALRQALQQLYERRGQLVQQLTALADDRRLPRKQLELQSVEKRLRQAVERWRTLAVCSGVLENVRAYYERERQPEALREASIYLERLTMGRYRRVWTPLGTHALHVDDSDGRSMPVEYLSCGTREQLFLALRLALVTAYSRRGAQLPLVLDDVLVNFDNARASAAAEVLRDFARGGYQILVFTCHEHIAAMFKRIKAEVRRLPSRLPHAEIIESSTELPTAESSLAAAPGRVIAEPVVTLAAPTLVEVVEEATPVVIEPVKFEASRYVPPSMATIVSGYVNRPSLVEVVLPPEMPYLPPQPSAQPVAPPPARAAVAKSPPPRPMMLRTAPAKRKSKAGKAPRVRRSGWDAEEFEGELSDRVREAGEIAAEMEWRPTARIEEFEAWSDGVPPAYNETNGVHYNGDATHGGDE